MEEDLYSYFRLPAEVEHKGKKYTIDLKTIKRVKVQGGDWIMEKDPHSMLCTKVVSHFKQKWGKILPREKVIELCAAILHKSPARLEGTLEWSAGYHAMRDGVSSEGYHIWPKEVEEENKGERSSDSE